MSENITTKDQMIDLISKQIQSGRTFIFFNIDSLLVGNADIPEEIMNVFYKLKDIDSDELKQILENSRANY